MVDSGSQVNITYRFLAETGEHQWAHMNASKLSEEDGYPVYYCVFTVPSDEATIYRNVVEDSADGVVVAEQKTRRIIYCNRAMREMYNIPLDIPLIGRRIQDFLPKGSVPLSRAEIKKLPKDSYPYGVYNTRRTVRLEGFPGFRKTIYSETQSSLSLGFRRPLYIIENMGRPPCFAC